MPRQLPSCSPRRLPGCAPRRRVYHGLDAAAAFRARTSFTPARAGAPAARVRTAGGRVLTVTGVGTALPTAIATAYAAADRIAFDGQQLRRDIGHRALRSR